MAKVTRSFERRRDAALRKIHLPTTEDLLYGMPFYGGELESDVREFSNRSVAVASSMRLYSLKGALTELSISASLEGVEQLASTVDQGFSSPRVQKFVDSVLLRRRIYLAAWGKTAPLSELAMETINAALTYSVSSSNYSETYLHLVFRSIELLASAAGSEPFQTYLPGNRIWHLGDDPDTNLLRTRGLRNKVSRLITDETLDAQSGASDIEEEERLSPAKSSIGSGDPSIVVLRMIGNSDTTEGKIASSYARDVAGKPIPLVLGKTLSNARDLLLSEFPQAGPVIASLLGPLANDTPLKIRPTIILGEPGSGKSHFCKRFMEVIGLPFTMIPFAGIADSAFIGTARRYSSGEPSVPVSTILTHKIANPGVILDEVEKAGTGSHNGNAIQSMLPMLEGVTASAYHDPYLQAPVDISHINWIMTANSLSALSRPFRDRCRVVEFPPPHTRYLDTYVANILPLLAKDRGQSAEMFLLDDAHKTSLKNWTDGSLRTLRKMLEAVLDEHESRGCRLSN